MPCALEFDMSLVIDEIRLVITGYHHRSREVAGDEFSCGSSLSGVVLRRLGNWHLGDANFRLQGEARDRSLA